MSNEAHFTPPGPLCASCGQCCKTMPGAMAPGDLPGDPVAAAAELVRTGRWCLDWWEGDTERGGPLSQVYYLRPAIKGHEGEVHHAGWRGECTFLGEQGCTLPRDSMPTGCRALRPTEVTGKACVNSYDKPQVAPDWRPMQTGLVAELGERDTRASLFGALDGLMDLIGGPAWR